VCYNHIAAGRRLLPRVLDNGQVLLDSYRAITRAIREERTVTPAARQEADMVADGLPAGRNSSRVSVWSAPYSGPTPTSRLWTLRHVIATGTRSRSCRGAHSTRRSKWPSARFSQAKPFRVAAQGDRDLPRDHREDPGYYLISKGRKAFERELGFRVPMKSWLRHAYLTQAAPRYLRTIAIVRGLILALFLLKAGAAAVGTVGRLLLGLLALIPALESGHRLGES
jgi:hypothetical protein